MYLISITLKNRHITKQFLVASETISKYSDQGWFCIDITSDCDNNDHTQIHNAMIKLVFSKLNGDGISRWIVILKDGLLLNFGEI